jgi:hypothetical protein
MRSSSCSSSCASAADCNRCFAAARAMNGSDRMPCQSGGGSDRSTE